MSTVHFSLGSELGKRITEIAQEKLMYDLDPTKALDTFIQSLCGFPLNLATRCLSGHDLKLVVNGDEIELTDKEVEGYPKIDFKYFIDAWEKDLDEIYKLFSETLCRNTLSKTRYYLGGTIDIRNFMRCVEDLDLSVVSDDLKKAVLQDIESQIEDDVDFDRIRSILILTKSYKKYNETYRKRVKVLEFIKKSGLYDVDDIVLVHMNRILDELKFKVDSAYLFNEAGDTDSLTAHIDADIENSKIVELTDIGLEQRNASWISPDGKRYGLNGEISNLLHNDIAIRLMEQGVIDVPENHRRNPYLYLEECGWVKQHNDWIMFEPHPYGMPTQFITESQAKIVKEYLHIHHGDIGKFGLPHNPITSFMFYQMDQFARNKLFEF